MRPPLPLGFGTANLYAGRNREQSLKLIRVALDAGITWFDTARLYGHGEAERILGEALRGRRPNVTVVSKAGILPSQITAAYRLRAKAAALAAHIPGADRLIPPPQPARPLFGAFGVAQIRTSVEHSLRALGTDYLDALLLHEVPVAEATRPDLLALLNDLKAEGKIRATGTATNLAATLKLAEVGFDVQQVAHSAWVDNVTTLRAASSAFVVTHSTLGRPLAILLERLKVDRAMRERARAHGFDPDASGLPQRLLALAIHRNPDGVVLFSSSLPQRIIEAVSATKIAQVDAEAAFKLIEAVAYG